jgi:molecular chaperone GrpE
LRDGGRQQIIGVHAMTDEQSVADQESQGPTPAADPAAEVATTPAAAPAPAEPAVAEPVVATSVLSLAIVRLQDANRATHDRLLRVAADFDNYKKRSRKDQTDAVRRAEEKLALEFLPILDNLERALAHAEGAQGTLGEGVAMVYKQFLATLERYEIRPFEAMDQPFDPERHEAIQQTYSDKALGTICQVMQKGYRRGEKLVRAAMVVVSLGPAPAKTAPAAAEPPPVEAAPSADEPKTGES